MRFSFVVICGLLVLLAITGAIGGFAYVSIGKTVSVLRELAIHHERVRKNFSELERLINTANRKFILLIRKVDQVGENDLISTFLQLKVRIHDVGNTSSISSSLTQDMDSMQSALEQFLRTHAERNTQPGAWKTAYSDLQRILAVARAALFHLASQDETKQSLTSHIRVAAAILDEFETGCRQFADQQTATLLEVVAPLNYAIETVEELEAGSAFINFIPELKHLALLRTDIAKFKAAAILFDDEIQLGVARENLATILNHAQESQLKALKLLVELRNSVQNRIVSLQRQQVAEGDERQLVLLISVFFSISIAGAVAAMLRIFLKRRITALVAGTKAVAQGNLEFRMETGIPDEFGQIATAINQMVMSLESNIEQRERAENDLKVLNDELEQRINDRTAELRDVQNELVRSERLAALGQLSATVSHELRNPLGTIRASMVTIRDRTRDKALGVERAVDRVERNIDRCDGIITELLDYARDREPVKVATRIDDWLGEVLDEQVPPAGITVRRELSSGAEAAFDRDTLRQAVVNVFENACQAMAEAADDGEKKDILTVATRTDGTSVEESITDTGPGIAAENLDKIFEPLFSTRSFGVGLGLSLVRKILEQHDGRVEVESAPGKGARAVLWLPLAEAKEEEHP